MEIRLNLLARRIYAEIRSYLLARRIICSKELIKNYKQNFIRITGNVIYFCYDSFFIRNSSFVKLAKIENYIDLNFCLNKVILQELKLGNSVCSVLGLHFITICA